MLVPVCNLHTFICQYPDLALGIFFFFALLSFLFAMIRSPCAHFLSYRPHLLQEQPAAQSRLRPRPRHRDLRVQLQASRPPLPRPPVTMPGRVLLLVARTVLLVPSNPLALLPLLVAVLPTFLLVLRTSRETIPRRRLSSCHRLRKFATASKLISAVPVLRRPEPQIREARAPTRPLCPCRLAQTSAPRALAYVPQALAPWVASVLRSPRVPLLLLLPLPQFRSPFRRALLLPRRSRRIPVPGSTPPSPSDPAQISLLLPRPPP